MPCYTKFTVNANDFPANLEKLLRKPKNQNAVEHPLAPYVATNLIPKEDISVLMLQDFNLLCTKYLCNDPSRFSEFFGMYIAIPHIWASPLSTYYVEVLLKNNYQIKNAELGSDLILMPEERPRYLSFVHEYLHAVFNHLPENTISEIEQSALDSYSSIDALLSFIGLKREEVYTKSWPKRLMLFDLTRQKRLRCLDEFIAHFFTTNRRGQRYSPECLPEAFKKTLSDVGYNIRNPPEQFLIRQP